MLDCDILVSEFGFLFYILTFDRDLISRMHLYKQGIGGNEACKMRTGRGTCGCWKYYIRRFQPPDSQWSVKVGSLLEVSSQSRSYFGCKPGAQWLRIEKCSSWEVKKSLNMCLHVVQWHQFFVSVCLSLGVCLSLSVSLSLSLAAFRLFCR